MGYRDSQQYNEFSGVQRHLRRSFGAQYKPRFELKGIEHNFSEYEDTVTHQRIYFSPTTGEILVRRPFLSRLWPIRNEPVLLSWVSLQVVGLRNLGGTKSTEKALVKVSFYRSRIKVGKDGHEQEMIQKIRTYKYPLADITASRNARWGTNDLPWCHFNLTHVESRDEVKMWGSPIERGHIRIKVYALSPWKRLKRKRILGAMTLTLDDCMRLFKPSDSRPFQSNQG